VTWQRQKIKNKDSKRAKGSREDAEKSDLTEEAIQQVNIRLHDLLDSTASKITVRHNNIELPDLRQLQ